MLLKRNLPRKMYSYGNILPRNYLSYIFEFQLFPFPFSLISGDSLMVSPSLLNYGRGTFLQKMPFMGEQILWGKFIGGLFYLGGLMIRSYQGESSFTECIFQESEHCKSEHFSQSWWNIHLKLTPGPFYRIMRRFIIEANS